MTAATLTLTDAARQAAELRTDRWWPRSSCCGASNQPCQTHPRDVFASLTGCDVCGHPLGCHIT